MFVNKFHVLALAALGGTMVASDPARASTLELEPSSNWVLDYADDSCALRRMFGEGDKRVQLEIRKFSPASTMQVTVVGNISRTTLRPFKFRFSPIQDWQGDDGSFYLVLDRSFRGAMFRTQSFKSDNDGDTDDGSNTAVNIEDHRKEELSAGAKITGLEVDGMFQHPISLKTGSLQAPLSAMQKCIDELMTHWGLDPEAQKTLQRIAQPKKVRLNFPKSMAKKGIPGVVNIRLDISSAGDVTGCHIQLPLSDPTYEKAACADLTRNLEIEPAIDKNGKPIASYWATSILYRIR